MPNKTIYVSEDDIPLFQRAQELGAGNLSAAIAAALRRFIEVQKMEERGFRQTSVRVGPPGSRQTKRFYGIRLARWRHPVGAGERVEEFVVYRTAGGRLALHVQEKPHWSYWSDPAAWQMDDDWNQAAAWQGRRRSRGWGEWWEPGAGRLEVFDTLEQLKAKVPEELYEMVSEALEGPAVEDLDI